MSPAGSCDCWQVFIPHQGSPSRTAYLLQDASPPAAGFVQGEQSKEKLESLSKMKLLWNTLIVVVTCIPSLLHILFGINSRFWKAALLMWGILLDMYCR